jgi:hypothetical protein
MMRISQLRREYLVEQSITYVSIGLFLITYADDTKSQEFVLGVGVVFSAFSLINILAAIIFSKFIRNWLSISSIAQIATLPFSILALFLGIAETSNKGYLDLRLTIFVAWIAIIVTSMLVIYYRLVSNHIKVNDGLKGFFYKLSISIGLMSSFIGIFLVFSQAFSLNTNPQEGWGKWANDPILFFAIATICVIPIVILSPDNQNIQNPSL